MRGRVKSESTQRGVALLAVLWLSVALTMIAMTTAFLVRSEAAAVSNHMAAEQAEFLARGGVDAAVYAILHGSSSGEPSGPEAAAVQRFQPGQHGMRVSFDGGSANVEVVPENAKLNVNSAPVEQLASLFSLLGEPAGKREELAAAIAE